MEKKCIKISNIKISPDKDTAFLEGIIRKELRLGKDAQIDYEIAKRSLDCRHKPQVMVLPTYMQTRLALLPDMEM